ncbi:NlpC/P60 family protein [Streptomyces sp. KR80]|uniref:NlpC/P60 family protein n=1 Tax=Streptomyces sp. KR80 TaxID=3457426 RepID=UPI003FD4E00B
MRRQGGLRVVTGIAVVCAVSGLIAPGVAQAASREPDPKPAQSAPSVSQPRPDRGLEKVRKEIDALYHKAEAATEAYNAVRAASEKQSQEIVRIARAIVVAQQKMERLRDQAGALARAQYRGGTLPDEAQMLLNSDPEDFLDDARLARGGQQATKGLMTTLARTQKDLDGYARLASQQWKRLEENRKKKAAAQKEIKARLAAAKELESRLEDEERERLRELEEEAARTAQAKWLESGVLDRIDGKASAAGKKAIRYATRQLGKDYEWGAEGPKTFDCSGLTSQAWLAAGRLIPRTSQEQWRQLPRVDIEDMRPGDLIIYHHDASHVGMYLGDGAMVHAPRPGRQVTVAGAGTMRILGVVRPDKERPRGLS